MWVYICHQFLVQEWGKRAFSRFSHRALVTDAFSRVLPFGDKMKSLGSPSALSGFGLQRVQVLPFVRRQELRVRLSVRRFDLDPLQPYRLVNLPGPGENMSLIIPVSMGFSLVVAPRLGN